MIEIIGDIWEQKNADVICIPTNGIVTWRGHNVMGKGLAKEARLKFPLLPEVLGGMIKGHGNTINVLTQFKVGNALLVSFPTKHDWRDNSNLELIEQSAKILKSLADFNKWKKVVLPKVGCGQGNLKWTIVNPILEQYFDDRFFIINPY